MGMADITVAFAARAIECVRAVSASEILPRFRSVVATRKQDGSLVTEADFAAQRALTTGLARIARAPVLGEEMPAAEQQAIWQSGGRFWCVDPIDGTGNFSAGIPRFAVSVALIDGDRPVFGIVYDPIADEAFYAVRGAGAWLNAMPMAPPASTPALRDACAEVDLRRSHAHLRHRLKDHPPYARRVTSGSSALTWCHVAAGRADLLLHAGQMVWDYMAGALILEEAGGSIAMIEADDFWAGPVWSRSVIAARRPALFAEWRDWVRANDSA
jgi:fructose-1,6-bisphosphatase/inositol monophosphatase family enzyme